MHPPTRLLNEHDAADVLGISVSSLRRWRSERRGHGPAWIKVNGSAVRYSADDLLEYINSCRRTPEPGGER
jgi:predicted DNA-binding transcriptional regulator AlpA